MTKQIELKTAMPNLMIDGGIFKHLPLYGDMTAVQMGILYALKHSGTSYISSLVKNYLDDDGTITAQGEQAIGLMMTNIFKDNWDARWAVYHEEYEPLENYNRDEKTTDTGSGSDQTQYGEITNTRDMKKAAFDSATLQPEGQDQDVIQQHTDVYTKGSKLTRESNIHGNIGVMSTQQMLNMELEARREDLIDQMFKDLDKYLTLHVK